MSRGGWIGLLCALALPWAASGTALAQSDDAAPETEAVVEDIATDQAAEDAGTPLTEDELEVVVARIALYPDELVALVVAASLYPLQIVEAERFLDKLESDPELEPDADWDGSVISLLNYPDIVRMMSEDLDWTQLVGELAVNQQKDMLVAIQQLRDEAVSDGVLKSNEQTVVVNDNDNVVIQSADPEVIYVPTYPPEMLYDPTYVVPPAPIVYSDPYPSYYYPSARFWTGVATGAVFAAAIDWNDWGTWGGNVDVNVKVDGDKINIKNNKINVKGGDRLNIKGGDRDIDLKNVDRSKIDFDKTQINRNQVKNNLKNNDFNKISNKVDKTSINRKNITQVNKGKDVRQNVQTGLKDVSVNKPALKKPPAAANRPKPAAKPAAVKRPAAKPSAPSRPSTSQIKKKVSQPKPGARPTVKKPSAMGSPRKGKPASIASNRGHSSRGGGIKGGSPHRGGGVRRR